MDALMATVYRVVSRDGDTIGDADSIDGVVEIVKDAAPDRYRIQRLSLDPSTGDLRSWDWGAITKSRKGLITLDLPPWTD
jgi:hypothetical protein